MPVAPQLISYENRSTGIYAYNYDLDLPSNSYGHYSDRTRTIVSTTLCESFQIWTIRLGHLQHRAKLLAPALLPITGSQGVLVHAGREFRRCEHDWCIIENPRLAPGQAKESQPLHILKPLAPYT